MGLTFRRRDRAGKMGGHDRRSSERDRFEGNGFRNAFGQRNRTRKRVQKRNGATSRAGA
ncbi:MAG: hypothetical protein CBARDCOR_3238 [uncultured Caballeronia sp.]|nr:MAG: hypothetical protein CBARDCOR_3238 [uncultured Caballeronia sp.]